MKSEVDGMEVVFVVSWTVWVMLRRRGASLSRPTSLTVRHSLLSERRCNNVTTVSVDIGSVNWSVNSLIEEQHKDSFHKQCSQHHWKHFRVATGTTATGRGTSAQMKPAKTEQMLQEENQLASQCSAAQTTISADQLLYLQL